MCTYMWVSVETRDLDPLELELQAIVSSLTWTLETELASSAKAVLTLNQ